MFHTIGHSTRTIEDFLSLLKFQFEITQYVIFCYKFVVNIKIENRVILLLYCIFFNFGVLQDMVV